MSGRLDVQFLSVNHNKYIPFSQDPNRAAKRTAAVLDASPADPRTTKGSQAFDLSSISAQLPPNTGPPGLVPVNGTGSSANSNKNLRHVPCKFYRQGICQAGNSCPFSHNLDGTLAADKLPCKYFQRGNCKFGLKCALAHILPDGTRVNSKSVYRRNEREKSQSNGKLTYNNYASAFSNGNYANNANYGHNTNQNYANGNARTASEMPGRKSSFHESGTLTSVSSFTESFSSNVFSDYHSASYSIYPAEDDSSLPIRISSQGSFLLNGFPAVGQNSGSNSVQSPFVSSLRTGNGAFGSYNERPSPLSRNLSLKLQKQSILVPSQMSLSSLGSSDLTMGLSFHSPQTQFSTPYSKPFSRINTSTSPLNSFLPETTDSAIADESESEDDNVFFEDYVPASLGNLILTPQERQRRNSRSQSGTLLVRPTVVQAEKTHVASEDVFLMD